MPKLEPKVIRDSNLDFRINPDLDFCVICPKMLWVHYLVGVTHFAKYGRKRTLIVREMLTNAQKSCILQWLRKFTRRSGSPPEVNQKCPTRRPLLCTSLPLLEVLKNCIISTTAVKLHSHLRTVSFV